MFGHGQLSFLPTGFIKFCLSLFFRILQGNMSSKLNCLVHLLVSGLQPVPVGFSVVFALRCDFVIYALFISCVGIVAIVWSLNIVGAIFAWSFTKTLVSIKFETWNLNVGSMRMGVKVSCVIISTGSWHIEWNQGQQIGIKISFNILFDF